MAIKIWPKLVRQVQPHYEVSRTVSTTTQRPSSQITGIQAAVLVREMEVVNPETGLTEVQKIPKEKLDEIEALVANAIGIDADRGDSLTVTSSTFVSALEGVKKPWYDMDWAVYNAPRFNYPNHGCCRPRCYPSADQPHYGSSCSGRP